MNTMIRVWIVGALLLPVAGSIAEEKDWSLPISRLPKQITYVPGKFSLHADFQSLRDGEPLVLYLINDTDKEVVLPSQDGDVYIKQEAKVNGEWVRSQPYIASWCGNSYYEMPPILPHQFAGYPAGYTGWVPRIEAQEGDKGEILPVRYRFYTDLHDVISNEGTLHVEPSLIKMAEWDSLAVDFAPVEKLLKLATGKVTAEGLDHMDPRTQAIGALGNFPGNPAVQQAIREIIATVPPAWSEEEFAAVNGKFISSLQLFSRKQARATALQVARKVLPPDEAWEIYIGVLKNVDDPDREEALEQLMKVPDRESEKMAILDRALEADYDHFWFRALLLRCDLWDEETRRVKLQAIIDNPALDSRARNEASDIYGRHFGKTAKEQRK